MLSNYDAYAIIVEPFEGYGAPFVWGIYRYYENAKKELESIAKNNGMSKSLVYGEDTVVNDNRPSFTNRYEKASIEGDFFEE